MISLDNREQVLTNNFIRNGLCHEDRWEIFFNHVVQDHIWIHWPTIYPWLKELPLRGADYWMARAFLEKWEANIIRAIPEDCGDTELPAITTFAKQYYPNNTRIIVGTVDEWLQLREQFKPNELAY